MISIFNRRELVSTFDLKRKSNVCDSLDSNNIDYYITSETLSGEELLTIAEGMGNSSLIVNGEK